MGLAADRLVRESQVAKLARDKRHRPPAGAQQHFGDVAGQHGDLADFEGVVPGQPAPEQGVHNQRGQSHGDNQLHKAAQRRVGGHIPADVEHVVGRGQKGQPEQPLQPGQHLMAHSDV